MSLNPETITQIQTMLQADPALLAELQTQTELTGVVAVISKAAAAQGLDVNEADLMSHLAAQQSQASAADMSDAELEQVAAGGIRITVGSNEAAVGLRTRPTFDFEPKGFWGKFDDFSKDFVSGFFSIFRKS